MTTQGIARRRQMSAPMPRAATNQAIRTSISGRMVSGAQSGSTKGG